MDYYDYYNNDECSIFFKDGYNYEQEHGIGTTMAVINFKIIFKEIYLINFKAYLGVSAFGLFANFFTLVIMFNATNLTRPRNYLIVSHMFTDCFQCSITMPVSYVKCRNFNVI